MSEIIIRASTPEDALDCGWKWYNERILPVREDIVVMDGFRAAIGTAVHSGVEALWNSKKHIIGETLDEVTEEDVNLMLNAGIACFDSKVVAYGVNDTKELGHYDIARGLEHFAKTLAIWVPVPEHTELNLTMEYKGYTVSGTIDYIGSGRVEDIKTSKKKISRTKHIIQQSIYTMLARHHGYVINENRLQGVHFKPNSVETDLIPIQINLARVEYYLDTIIAKLEMIKDGVDPIILFHANPRHEYCYGCSQYPCPATQSPKSSMGAI